MLYNRKEKEEEEEEDEKEFKGIIPRWWKIASAEQFASLTGRVPWMSYVPDEETRPQIRGSFSSNMIDR